MKKIRLKISEIFELDPQITDQPKDLATITAYVLKHYAFLPKPIIVTLEGDEVVISYPEEANAKREEAERLAARAVKQSANQSHPIKAKTRAAAPKIRGRVWEASDVVI